MKIVAQMMCRNEFDVIEECVAEVMRWVDTLLVLDGKSDDGTWSLLCDLASEYGAGGKVIRVESESDRDDRFRVDLRNKLLAMTAEHDPDWVFSVDADEIYHYDPEQGIPSPVEAIEAAEAAGGNVVMCQVPQFWLTFADLRNGALHEDERESVQKRRRWYSWGHSGRFMWKWNGEHFYPKTSKRTPELPGLSWTEWQRPGPLYPVCKHYCFRSLGQGLKRAEDRLANGGRKYFGKYALRWVIDEVEAGLHYLGEGEMWNVLENHQRVRAWMAGESQGVALRPRLGARVPVMR
jgi:hypothetical protein